MALETIANHGTFSPLWGPTVKLIDRALQGLDAPIIFYVTLTRAREARRHGTSRRRAMGSRREAGRDCDWLGGLGLAHARLGSVEF
jgi:hypothetical protein